MFRALFAWFLAILIYGYLGLALMSAKPEAASNSYILYFAWFYLAGCLFSVVGHMLVGCADIAYRLNLLPRFDNPYDSKFWLINLTRAGFLQCRWSSGLSPADVYDEARIKKFYFDAHRNETAASFLSWLAALNLISEIFDWRIRFPFFRSTGEKLAIDQLSNCELEGDDLFRALAMIYPDAVAYHLLGGRSAS